MLIFKLKGGTKDGLEVGNKNGKRQVVERHTRELIHLSEEDTIKEYGLFVNFI
jgi:hypothetical protein